MASHKIIKAFQIIRNYGAGFLAFRAQYALRKKFGLLKRRFTTVRWSQVSIESWLRADLKERSGDFLEIHKANGRRFFFAHGNLPELKDEWKEQAVREAEAIVQNKFRYFFDKSYSLGAGPDWFLNPTTERRAEPTRHWCDISLFDPNVGDIKFIWEPSRFAWAYTLVRAYTATGQDRYAEKFWSLFESWLEANQPNMGPNYACGQECAIRLMAMCFALYALSEANASTAERRIKLITAIAVHADRIEKNINFAISTRTNHSLTEAAGLYTAGLLFPQFKRSDHWLRLGKKVLTNEGLKQIYPDGSYIQHSMNYHRLMLQDFLWVIRLAQLNGDSFDSELISRVKKATDFLYQMQDNVTGRVPNYGANDGALIVPLNSCNYLDYRPVIQSAHYLFNKSRLYESGLWDEDLVWFFGPEALNAELKTAKQSSNKYLAGGYYTVRGKNSWAMIRCHTYRERVGHVDTLHLDLWTDGINLLRDCGTYRYFAPDEPELEQYFKSIWSHNTVIVDDASPLRAVSRFTRVPWPKAELNQFSQELDTVVWKGTSFAYDSSPWCVIHCRQVTVDHKDRWEIIDQLGGQGQHKLELRWHLPAEVRVVRQESGVLQLQLPGQWHLEVNDSKETQFKLLKSQMKGGYESLYYSQKQAICTLSITKYGQVPVTFKTIIYK